jgi:hypothetical protein
LAAKYNILPIARSSLGFKDAPLKSQELKWDKKNLCFAWN